MLCAVNGSRSQCDVVSHWCPYSYGLGREHASACSFESPACLARRAVGAGTRIMGLMTPNALVKKRSIDKALSPDKYATIDFVNPAAFEPCAPDAPTYAHAPREVFTV